LFLERRFYAGKRRLAGGWRVFQAGLRRRDGIRRTAEFRRNQEHGRERGFGRNDDQQLGR
jgi:hypothetical protein